MITTIEHPGLLAIHASDADDADEAKDLALDALEQRLRVVVMRKAVGITTLIFSARRTADNAIWLGLEHGSAKHKSIEAAVADGMRKFRPTFIDDRDGTLWQRDDRRREPA